MSDVFDQAQERDAINLEASLALQLGRSSAVEVKPTGTCNYCFEDLDKGALNPRFCDAKCRDGYDFRVKLRR